MDHMITVEGVGRHHARRALKWLKARNIRGEFHAPGRLCVYVAKYGEGWTADFAAKALVDQSKAL